MSDLQISELIYDWNQEAGDLVKPIQPVEFNDETLRDGLQSPSVKDPSIEAKIEILHLMDQLGIHTANIGLPGAGPRAVADVTGGTTCPPHFLRETCTGDNRW